MVDRVQNGPSGQRLLGCALACHRGVDRYAVAGAVILAKGHAQLRDFACAGRRRRGRPTCVADRRSPPGTGATWCFLLCPALPERRDGCIPCLAPSLHRPRTFFLDLGFANQLVPAAHGRQVDPPPTTTSSSPGTSRCLFFSEGPRCHRRAPGKTAIWAILTPTPLLLHTTRRHATGDSRDEDWCLGRRLRFGLHKRALPTCLTSYGANGTRRDKGRNHGISVRPVPAAHRGGCPHAVSGVHISCLC